jgi:hypothetical protein
VTHTVTKQQPELTPQQVQGDVFSEEILETDLKHSVFVRLNSLWKFNYRHQKVNGQYLPQGGTLNDGGVKADFWLGTSVTLSGSVQYEKWNYPVMAPSAQSNVTTSVQFTFWPHRWK